MAIGSHYFPPDLQLFSQLQSITAPWSVPSYTAWWQRHMGVNNLPKVVTQLLPRVGFEPMTCWSQVQHSTCGTTSISIISGVKVKVSSVELREGVECLELDSGWGEWVNDLLWWEELVIVFPSLLCYCCNYPKVFFFFGGGLWAGLP